MSSKRKLPALILSLVSIVVTSLALAVTPREQEIIDRIKPVGEVCIQGKNECAAPVVAVAASPRSGEQVYTSACAACHTVGVAGAPKTGVAADWEARIAQGPEMLLDHAMKGFKGMPPMGTCMNCSGDEIQLAIEHMLAQGQ